MTKLLYVCLDGLGDDPNPALDGKTPLEAAATPHLDALAAAGRTGSVVTVGEGIAPESDIGVFAILGYDPSEEHPGRGVIEAIGTDMDFEDGNLAYRINFATAQWPEIIDRRVGRDLSSTESAELAAEVNEKLSLSRATFEVRATVEHRGVLVIKSTDGPLSSNVTNTDPAYAKQGSLGVALETFDAKVAQCEPLDDSDEAERAATLTNAFVEESYWIMEKSTINEIRRIEGKLPGNLILTRDGGDKMPHLQPIKERFGLTWGCFVEMPVERGIALTLGMESVPAPRVLTDDQYAEWADLAADALGDFQALYVHLKGPDVPAHDGNAELKRKVIADIDRAFFGEVLPKLDMRNTVIAVCADHSTSCVRAAHTADPVPLLISGGPVTRDGSRVYGESEAAQGSIGNIRGVDILPQLVQVME